MAIKEYHLDVPYPTAVPANLEIRLGAPAKIEATDGACDSLVKGMVRYDRIKWMPEVTTEGNTVRLLQAERWEDRPTLDTKFVNEWKLQLGNKKPYSLNIRNSVGEGHWELGGLPLTRLSIGAGVSRNRVFFSQPNPDIMEDFTIQTGVNEASFSGLLNANFRDMFIEAGVGDLTLSFTGQSLRQDCNVRVHAGVARFTINVAAGIPALVKVSGISGTRALGEFKRQSESAHSGFLGDLFSRGTFATKAFTGEEGKPQLRIEITSGVGDILLNTV